METIKDRTLKIPTYMGVSKDNFISSIGMSYGSFKGAAKKTALNSDAIVNILTKCPEVNPVWLLTGEGDMIIEPLDSKEKLKLYHLRTDHVKESQDIPIFNIEASAGSVRLFDDMQKQQPIDYIRVPNLPKCDGAIYITGDSMYPALKSGDLVMYKVVTNISDGIFFGEIYIISLLIDDEEYVMVKYVKKSELGKEYIKLVSENKHHGDKDVALKMVKSLALVKATIRINSMN